MHRRNPTAKKPVPQFEPAYLAGRREMSSTIFIADLLDHPAKIELEATAIISPA